MGEVKSEFGARQQSNESYRLIMQLSDRVTGTFLVALGALTTFGGSRLPPVPGQPVGPNIFPIVIGVGLCLCGALIMLRIGQSFEDDAVVELSPDDPAYKPLPPPMTWAYGLRALIPPALLLFYALASESIGFIPAAAIIAFVTSMALGASLRLAIPVAIFSPLFVHLVFAKLLRVPLPAGWLPMPW
jgi:putative tricarboxylic transport membrane protein